MSIRQSTSRDDAKTALIVEDNRDQADLVARLLRQRDYEPILAEDG
jgi:hypothetical protein